VRFRFKRLSHQILLVFVLVIATSLGVSGWFVLQFSEDIITQRISEGDRNFAGRIAQEIETEMASIKPTLTLLAQTPGLRLMEATEVKGDIDRVQRGSPDITSIYVADIEGEQIARVGTGQLENVSGIRSFQVAKEGEKLFSDIYLEPTTLEPMQTVTLPIMDSGTVVGVLSADISFRRIMLSFVGIDIGEGGNVVVVADNGRVVAHTQMEQAMEFDLARLPVVEAVLDGEEGTMKGYTDELGREVLGSYMPIKELGWGVLIQRPVADIDDEVGQLRTTIIWVMIAAVLLVVPVGWLMSRRIAKPIGQLASASERVAQGDLSTQVDVKSSNEVGALAHSFNQMIVSLKKSRDELQQWSEELDKKNYNLFALFEASRALGPPLDIQEILELAIDMFVEMIRADHGLIMMLEEETGELVARAAKGLSKDFMAQAKLEITEHAPQQLLQLEVPVSLTDADSKLKDYCPALYQKLTQVGIELCIPLATRDKLIGLVALSKKETGAGFSASDLEFLSTIAKQVVSSLENTQLVKTIQKWGEDLENKVQERTQELDQKSQELTSMNLRLEEASRAKSDFLASMSHELRTPLNSIIGYTKLMLDGLEGDINEEQQKDLHTVYTNSKHLLELINDLLDISKIEAGKIVLNYETLNISELLDGVIPVVEQLAREKGLTLTYSAAPDIGNPYADTAKIKQVLINILGNAIKFTNEGGVKLDIAETDSDFTFSVTDTGIGIKEEDLEAIFDSFKQVGLAQIAGYEGTGLGLAISKQFIEMQGGKIWAESKLGKGTTVTFTLPKKKADSS